MLISSRFRGDQQVVFELAIWQLQQHSYLVTGIQGYKLKIAVYQVGIANFKQGVQKVFIITDDVFQRKGVRVVIDAAAQQFISRIVACLLLDGRPVRILAVQLGLGFQVREHTNHSVLPTLRAHLFPD